MNSVTTMLLIPTLAALFIACGTPTDSEVQSSKPTPYGTEINFTLTDSVKQHRLGRHCNGYCVEDDRDGTRGDRISVAPKSELNDWVFETHPIDIPSGKINYAHLHYNVDSLFQKLRRITIPAVSCGKGANNCKPRAAAYRDERPEMQYRVRLIAKRNPNDERSFVLDEKRHYYKLGFGQDHRTSAGAFENRPGDRMTDEFTKIDAKRRLYAVQIQIYIYSDSEAIGDRRLVEWPENERWGPNSDGFASKYRFTNQLWAFTIFNASLEFEN